MSAAAIQPTRPLNSTALTNPLLTTSGLRTSTIALACPIEGAVADGAERNGTTNADHSLRFSHRNDMHRALAPGQPPWDICALTIGGTTATTASTRKTVLNIQPPNPE